MEISRTTEADLPPLLARQIEALQHLAFPSTEEFEHQRWWHTPLSPQDVWITARRDERLIASLRIIHRQIKTPAGPWTMAGVGNVCSHPDARGSGAASACLRAAAKYIATAADVGMLFCEEQNAGFYARSGWHAVDNLLWLLDETGHRESRQHVPSARAMILPGRRALADWPSGAVDLNGRDW